MHIGRYEDRGGYRVYVKWFGRNSNLHRVWDSDMINGYNMSYSELAENLPTPEKLEIEFEREGEIEIKFVPIRPGEYDFEIERFH